MLSLKDKNIIVTGASSGIGRSCAVLAGGLGARVILVGRNESRLAETLSLMAEGDHCLIAHDVTDYPGLAQKLGAALGNAGTAVHGLIHSAGAELTKPFSLTVPEDYRQLLEVNLIAGLELCRFASKRKHTPEGGASYVFVSSVMAVVGSSGKIAYCASKSALTSAVRALALELAAKKIRVNAVQPGCIETPLLDRIFSAISEEEISQVSAMHPLGLGSPESVANLCCFLLSDLSNWITGTNIPVDGGYSAH